MTRYLLLFAFTLAGCLRRTNDGEQCLFDDQCDAGLECLSNPSAPEVSVCSVACETVDDCPDDIYGWPYPVDCANGLCANVTSRR